LAHTLFRLKLLETDHDDVWHGTARLFERNIVHRCEQSRQTFHIIELFMV
jgi:hypothetical protein